MKRLMKTLLVLTMVTIIAIGSTTGVFAKEGSAVQGMGQGQMPTELKDEIRSLRDMSGQNRELFQQVLTKRNQFRETFENNVQLVKENYQDQVDEFKAIKEETQEKMQEIVARYNEAVEAGAADETLSGIIEEATVVKALIKEHQNEWNKLKEQIRSEIEKCKPYEDDIMGYMEGIKARIQNEKTLAAQLKEKIREENYEEAYQIVNQIKQLKTDNNTDLETVLDLLSE